MKTLLKTGGSLLVLAAFAGAMTATPAAAQDAAAIQSIQQQIQQLQSQLRKLQAESASRDAALRKAQDEAAAARAQAAAATAQATAAQQAATTMQVAAPAAPVPPPGPPLPKGAFRVGGVTVTLGGFAALEGLTRSRNQASSIDTNFNGSLPFANSPNYKIPEFRETAQQSRFSLKAEGDIDENQKLTSFMETDFLSAGTSSNSNQSNSYTLRLRQFWGAYDNSAWGLHVAGGQTWSLATMNRYGMLPGSENVPLTIDAQYVVGYDWARQADIRVVKDFDAGSFGKYWVGIAAEEPQTIFSSGAGNNCLTGATTTVGVGGGLQESTQCGGSNVNSIQAYSDNNAPDIILKAAADPGFGHYEVYGLMRFFDGRVSFPAGSTGGTPGTGSNNSATGQGVGAGMILPLVPKMLDFQVSGLYGQGVGRYGSAQIADVTFDTHGHLKPLTEYSAMVGLVGHPVPSVDVYAYGGVEGADQKSFSSGTVFAGYGNPNVSVAGCEVELGSCSAVSHNIWEGTIGAWWRPYKGNYGTLQVGAQYEYLERVAFPGTNGTKGTSLTPSTNDNVFLFSARYYPFQ
jgi:hypothetical protein